MSIMEILLSFVAGLVIAALVAVFVVKKIVRTRTEQAEMSVKLQVESMYKAENASLQSDLKHYEDRVKELQSAVEAAKAEGSQQVVTAKAEAAKALESAKGEWAQRHKEDMDALQARFDETMAKVTAQVKAETNEMLKARQKEFSESSNLSLGQIVNPLKENIAELKKAMEEGNKEQAERNGEMRERIKSLMEHSDAARKSADELAAAFKHGSKIQGDWGETVLDELLTSHGLTRGVHFDIQAVIKDKDGKVVKNEEGSTMRPDVILHLDERREVIIDSKVSLTSYVDYVNAENEIDRAAYLKAHVDSIKKHVKELAAKDYSAYVQSPKVSAGYVIMFVPNIGALWTALKAEPDLWRKAAEANVYITDEQSLYGALKIVSLTWTQVAQTQNHEQVYKLANEMIERVGLFVKKYDAIGVALEKATSEFNEGKKKLLPTGQSIINTSNKLIKLGAKNSDKHPIPTLLDVDEIQQIEG
ncbi:MAG: DNA recombination protein RmuC [Bacteroidales bacterium]|nr:DNA recombination protein RmuC [Bacteroidales bacterium]